MSASRATVALRDAHKALTQDRIVEAALALIRREGAEALSFAGLAMDAGVTERTIYRHFATREDLLAAVWKAVNDLLAVREFADTKAALVAQPRSVFLRFDSEDELMRMVILSRQGVEIRKSANAVRQAAVRKAVGEARPDLDDDAQRRLAGAVQALNSAYGWMVMKDFAGLSGDEAGVAASEAIALLLEARPGREKVGSGDPL